MNNFFVAWAEIVAQRIIFLVLAIVTIGVPAAIAFIAHCAYQMWRNR